VHGVSLSTACLPLSENTHIEPIYAEFDQVEALVKHLLLFRLVVETLIELEHTFFTVTNAFDVNIVHYGNELSSRVFMKQEWP